MLYRLVRPMRRKGSSQSQFVKRIPEDLLSLLAGQTLRFELGPETYSICITKKTRAVRFSLRTSDPVETRMRAAQALAYIEGVFSSLRAGLRELSHKETLALAGEWYRTFVAEHEENPGRMVDWELWRDLLVDPLSHFDEEGDGVHQPLYDPKEGARRLEALLPIDDFLKSRGLSLTPASRIAFAREAAHSLAQASQLLSRRAGGDYSPDTDAERFPAWSPPATRSEAPGERSRAKQGAAGTPDSITKLLDDWWREAAQAGRALSTWESYRATASRFVAFLGHDELSQVTARDVVAFKDHRLSQLNPRTREPLSSKTVNDSDLAALKALFNWAVRNHRMAENPALNVKATATKKTKLRSKGFTEEEANEILGACLAIPSDPLGSKADSAKRWAPWICAYTGSRIGEVVQLRRGDVQKEGEFWTLTITPEAGTVKNGETRVVPLHSHLIKLGFLDFVHASADGHLFLNPKSDGETRGVWKAAKNRVREFVRTIVTDPNVAPNHGWRHRFKTVAFEVGVQERVTDAICGHAPRTVGARYGDITVKTMAAAMKLIPTYSVSVDEAAR